MRQLSVLLIVGLLASLIALVAGCDGDDPVKPHQVAWFAEAVDTAEITGYYSSIAVDGGGLPHIVYLDVTRNDLNYARFNGSEWLITVIDPDVDGKGNDTPTSLSLDSLGRPHVAYRERIDEELRYASWTGVDWVIDTVDTSLGAGRFTSLALNGHDQPLISYSRFDGVYLAVRSNDNWVIETVDTGSFTTHTSIAVDTAGTIHIAYQKNSSILYAQGHVDQWSRDTVVGPDAAFEYCSLDLTPAGEPRVAFLSGAPRGLGFAARVAGSWTSQIIDPAPNAGLFCSIAVDNNGLSHIVHWRHSLFPNYPVTRGLYAYEGNGWNSEIIDTTEAVGAFIAIALDNSGRPHVSYQDPIRNDLKYAVQK